MIRFHPIGREDTGAFGRVDRAATADDDDGVAAAVAVCLDTGFDDLDRRVGEDAVIRRIRSIGVVKTGCHEIYNACADQPLIGHDQRFFNLPRGEKVRYLGP